MKKLAFSCLTLALAVTSLVASDQPRGRVLELHSCELYAGGCVVSSEATLDGRYMLRAWSFNGGRFQDTDLAGLQVAVLQCSSDNLAADDVAAQKAVVYLPRSATVAQREALLNWVKALPDLKSAQVHTRIESITLSNTGTGFRFSAGSALKVETASLESCEPGACGEALWYTPRAPANAFTVAVNRASQVTEPLLQLNWKDGGRRSVFLGRFGDAGLSQSVFVTAADLCGPANKLF